VAAALGGRLVFNVQTGDAGLDVLLNLRNPRELRRQLGEKEVGVRPIEGVRTVRATISGPPKPVSASAMTGTVRSSEAIMPALVAMSSTVVRPRSGIPRRDMAVPAPVYWSCQSLVR
jgi:hypothetical protein